MRHTFTLSLLLLMLLIPGLLWAEDRLSSIPVPDPHINESMLIQGTGWSAGGTRNESLACDLAENRAIRQLKKGIAVARAKGLITTQELSRALPLTRYRNWDPRAGRCTIRLELEVPVLPKTGVPIMLERQF
jgi:hypothetical protein